MKQKNAEITSQNFCVHHNLVWHHDSTGCVECLRESHMAIAKKQVGRPKVGVACRDGAKCENLEKCRSIYTQDFLNEDGSCPHFKAGCEDL
ncbi:MAG: hypothetical protein HQL69_07610 [Magnetococcales bacterium]|nr:hypothetical protein [Magnetococcales bacterium]